ncbi:hypothetical protein GF359_09985 [candidate division WOR-3 bacterium]|uniref:Uncharacterized protein n=1 Tax=candidate division WOR-3 bacterium TaxID=2052148 RepID=A0A9D5KCG2_UNCW3|nr:hypothetical protein [candidate division WOR-3 bacterium]MBD3365530.1 hypothetical protein [candidate division WOR-3 bacterium]
MRKTQSPLARIASIAATIFLLIAASGAAFVAGYGLCFARFTDAYAELSVLKARAVEIEEELLHLKNYAVLIDALTTHGKAAVKLRELPLVQSPSENESVGVKGED